MLTNVIAAVKYVDPVLIRAARTMDVGGRALFFTVLLPAATPRLLAGARVALGVGFMVIVGAEMIGTIHGLGALIMEARTFYRTDISLVGMVAARPPRVRVHRRPRLAWSAGCCPGTAVSTEVRR